MFATSVHGCMFTIKNTVLYLVVFGLGITGLTIHCAFYPKAVMSMFTMHTCLSMRTFMLKQCALLP